MTEDVIKFAFSAGELSPHLMGRVDIEKFDLGVAAAENFFIDYRGGATTRAGTRFGDQIQHEGEPFRLIRFKFNTEIANTYVLVFSKGRLRFVQDGAYVLEATKDVVAITTGATTVAEVTGHGYANGDWLYFSEIDELGIVTERVVEVGSATADTFEILDHRGNSIDTSTFSYLGGGVVQRVHTVASPYATADLATLKYHQRQDEVAFTHLNYPIYTLVRAGALSWTLAPEAIAPLIVPPTGITLTPSSAGSAGYAVTITSLNKDGAESLPARFVFNTSSVDFTSTAGSLLIKWSAVPGAVAYNVYRTKIFPTGTQVTYAEQAGFIGKALGPQFVDNNIIPDFVVTPPKFSNPFVHGGIESITITGAGTLYSRDDTVSVSGGGGSGFVGYPIVTNAGEILGVIIINPGSGYVSPTVSFGTSTGSGATATATAGALTGNNPAAVAVYSQRRTYGGSVNNPLTVWGSKVRDFDNFDVSDTPNAGDSYQFALDSDEVNAIRHLMSARNGLMVFTKTEVASINGVDGQPVSAVGAEADGQIAPGASHVTPLFVNGNILYIREKGSAAIQLSYNGFARSFEHEEISTLSNHLFGGDHTIQHWDYAEHPNKTVLGTLSDGHFVFLTYLPDQKVVAWTHNHTKGLVKDVCVIEENNLDMIYLGVVRKVQGQWDAMFEMMQTREWEQAEDSWSVDAALDLPRTYPAATLTPAAASGENVSFTASASIFSANSVGKYIRVGGGKAVITSYVSGTEVLASWERDMEEVLQEDAAVTPIPATEGDWTMDAAFTSVSGLWHLEGETVRILADGNVKQDTVVTGGTATWTGAASRVVVGLGYSARLRTLPITLQGVTTEGKRKSIKGVVVRTYRTRGLAVGALGEKLYEMKDRSTEAWGDPTQLRSDMQLVPIQAGFTEDGQFEFQQNFPLPATVLGYVASVDFGDTDTRGR